MDISRENIDKLNAVLSIKLDKWGRYSSDTMQITENNSAKKIIISSQRISVHNKYQYFKTTNRILYDLEFKKYSKANKKKLKVTSTAYLSRLTLERGLNITMIYFRLKISARADRNGREYAYCFVLYDIVL